MRAVRQVTSADRLKKFKQQSDDDYEESLGLGNSSSSSAMPSLSSKNKENTNPFNDNWYTTVVACGSNAFGQCGLDYMDLMVSSLKPIPLPSTPSSSSSSRLKSSSVLSTMTSYALDIDCSSTLSSIVVVEKGTDSKGYIWGSGITNFLFITLHSLCTTITKTNVNTYYKDYLVRNYVYQLLYLLKM